MEYLTCGDAETEALAAELARSLKPGAVLALRGGLGMGKTAFVRGLARGLGFPGRVTSPTFTIVNEYIGGRLPLFHFDLYRLSGSDDLFAIGWDEYPERGGVCAVEWSELAADALPPETVTVTLERAAGADDCARRVTVRFPGETDGTEPPSETESGADTKNSEEMGSGSDMKSGAKPERGTERGCAR